MKTNRRHFVSRSTLITTATCLGTTCSPLRLFAAETPPGKHYRAAVIGRTGGGDYGHGYDRIFAGMENVTVETVADADAEGLRKAAERCGARRQYRDYREMLQKEKPDLVSIAPRHPDCHKDMALAAIEVCSGMFMEKPFTETVADADTILAAAEKRSVKIIVAHNRRWSPEFTQVKALLDQGLIGRVREVRIQGKQDQRAGGEDMIVLGTHDFDLMRYYFGNPGWCSARVTAAGHDIKRADVRRGSEPIRVAGDTIHATFGFPRNLAIHWSSVKTDDHWNTSFSKREKWAFEILGTKGIIAYQSGLEFAWLDSPFLALLDGAVKWQSLPKPSDWDPPLHSRQPIRSLIHAIETGGQPVCSGSDARWAIEMVAAVYESQRTRSHVALPLVDRENPLERLGA